jgi:hypothetical protein
MFGERKQVRVGRVGNVTLQSAGGETDLKRLVRTALKKRLLASKLKRGVIVIDYSTVRTA